MISKQLKDILLNVSGESFITAENLAQKIGISPKTVRLRIRELNELLKDYDAQIISKPRFGFRLEAKNLQIIQELFDKDSQNETLLPNTNQERVMYLLAYLINNDNYIKIDDLCDFLYVSKSTLSNALKKVDEILEQYGIHIERRPNYGIKAIGDEINFRRCMSDYFVKRNSLGIDENIEEVEARDKIADILYQLMNKYNVNMSETGFQNLVDNISVGIRRMKRGKYIHFADDSLLKPSNIVHFMVGELTRDLQGIFEIEYSEDEKNYIEVLLAGRRMVGDGKRDEINFVIHENIDQLVMDMLELIYQTYRIDLRSNFEVRMSLNQHLVPLDIRMRYHIPLENPMLNEIKDEYMFPFTMASQVSAILSDYYHRVISEGEIGYLALIFALALEQQKNPDYSKYNILIVCSSGKGSARLLMYKYQQTFGKYINQIYLCNQFELNGFDFSKVQYVFTTIPIV